MAPPLVLRVGVSLTDVLARATLATHIKAANPSGLFLYPVFYSRGLLTASCGY